jgi:hypothetical protein
MASCPGKYNNNEDSHGLLEHNPLKSSYDTPQPTNNYLPRCNDNSATLFEVEKNDRGGIDNDINSQHSTNGSDLDINPTNDCYKNNSDDDSYNPQGQLSTAVSKVQIKLNNIINNHKALLKLHNDIVNSFNEYKSSPNLT